MVAVGSLIAAICAVRGGSRSKSKRSGSRSGTGGVVNTRPSAGGPRVALRAFGAAAFREVPSFQARQPAAAIPASHGQPA